MSFFSFSQKAAFFDVTPIENEFLMDLMPGAPEDALRVYLYARMLCLHPEIGDLAAMSKALRMDSDEVFDALRYWEQQGLVEKLSDQPPRYQVFSLRERAAMGQSGQDFYKYAQLHASLNEIFEGKELKNKHFKMAAEWLEIWGMAEEAALEIVRFERRLPGGKTPDPVFKRADERVKTWAEQGVRSLEEVKRAIAFEERARDMAAAVFEQLAIRRDVTKNELQCVFRWIGEWHLTVEDVIEACAHTLSARDPSIAYLDAILKSQVEKGPSVYFGAMKEVLRELNAANPTPTPQQLNQYAQYLKDGFEPEAIRLAAIQNAKKNRNRFQDLEWMLNSWGELGVRTHDQAEAFIRDMEQKRDEMGALMKLAGITRFPNRVDLEYYEGWKRKYDAKLFRSAAELSRGAGDPLKQMDALLAGWAGAGVSDPDAARAAAPKILQDAASAGRISVPRHQNYLQHSYSDDDFGKDFFYDLDRDHPEEGGKQ